MSNLTDAHMAGRYAAYATTPMPEALVAVTILNEELYEAFADSGGDVDVDLLNLVVLEYVAAGDCETVLFLGRPLWDDQSPGEGRTWSEAMGDYEPPLIDHLRQEMRNLIAALHPIHKLGQPKAGKTP
jgi:hypothetical protein